MLRIVKATETKNRLVVIRDLGEGEGGARNGATANWDWLSLGVYENILKLDSDQIMVAQLR
jgi:hypothetical protein